MNFVFIPELIDDIRDSSGLKDAFIVEFLKEGWFFERRIDGSKTWSKHIWRRGIPKVPLPIEAQDLAVGDYDPMYGTIKKIESTINPKTKVVESVDLYFWNGKALTGVEPDRLFYAVQGGLTDHGPEGSIREGLAADHANES